MKISLIICPWYSGGSSVPLGLGYINATLKALGHTTYPLDLEFELNRINPFFSNEINRLFGYKSLEDGQVTFIIQLERLLRTLYPAAYKRTIDSKYKSEQRSLSLIKKTLEAIIISHFKRFPFEVCLFSVYSTNIAISLLTAQLIKKRIGCQIIFGGPGVSLQEIYPFMLKTGLVDGVVVGEGEATISEVLKIGIRLNPKISLPGYATKDTLNSFQSRPLIENIDKIPYPDFEDFPVKGYNLRAYYLSGKSTFLPIATSRGCFMKCAFCSESQFWKRFRLRSANSVVEEIQYQINKYSLNHIRFNDSLTNPNNNWLEDLCNRIIGKKLHIQWLFTYMRPQGINRALATKLKKAGCKYVCLGVESGSWKTRIDMKKGTQNSEIIKVLNALAEEGIDAGLNILNGFPNEPLQQWMDNFRFFIKWRATSQSRHAMTLWIPGGRMRLEPYSDIYLHPEAYGIKIIPNLISVPEELSPLKDAINRISLRWEDSIPEVEKSIRNELTQYFFLKYQPYLLKNYEKYNNIQCSMICETSLLQSIEYPFLRMIRNREKWYSLVRENLFYKSEDPLSFHIYKLLLFTPLQLNRIIQKIQSLKCLKTTSELITQNIINMINHSPYPLLRLKESQDMRQGF